MRRGLGLLLALGLAACAPKPAPAPRLAFYYWRTAFHFDADDQAFMAQARASRLYTRCFDVDWDKAAGRLAPVAPLQGLHAPGPGIEWVPVVYITTAALQRLTPAEAPALAGRILGKVQAQRRQAGLPALVELQLDADWTPSTEPAYFALLRAVKAGLKRLPGPPQLSATLRLHQLAHRKACSVPPVDRCVLMAYHTRSPLDYQGRDSILDRRDAAAYWGGLHGYPLPLGLALPAFHWAVVYGQDRKARRILDGVGADALAQGGLRRRWFSWGWDVRQDGRLAGAVVQRGDRVRLDGPSLGTALAVAADVQARADRQPDERAYFDYDREALAGYSGGDARRLGGKDGR